MKMNMALLIHTERYMMTEALNPTRQDTLIMVITRLIPIWIRMETYTELWMLAEKPILFR